MAGNIHLEQFPPLMAELFGRDWYRTGNLSLYFLTPTTDGEPVQVFARAPVARDEGGMRAEVWMEDAEGRRTGPAMTPSWRVVVKGAWDIWASLSVDRV